MEGSGAEGHSHFVVCCGSAKEGLAAIGALVFIGAGFHRGVGDEIASRSKPRE